MVKPTYDHHSWIKEAMPEYDPDRELNLKPGDLVIGTGTSYRMTKNLKGFIIRKTQARRPHRTDVYLVRFQNEEPKEVDERWLQRIENEEG